MSAPRKYDGSYFNKDDEYLSELIRLTIMYKAMDKYILYSDEIIDNICSVCVKISIDDIISKELVQAAIDKTDNFNFVHVQTHGFGSNGGRKIKFKQNGDIILNDKENNQIELIVKYKINIEEFTDIINLED